MLLHNFSTTMPSGPPSRTLFQFKFDTAHFLPPDSAIILSCLESFRGKSIWLWYRNENITWSFYDLCNLLLESCFPAFASRHIRSIPYVHLDNIPATLKTFLVMNIVYPLVHKLSPRGRETGVPFNMDRLYCPEHSNSFPTCELEPIIMLLSAKTLSEIT